ncbi:Bifunctional protein: zinc-containing alcohol dehydrogenase; quinone oxidoreductase (NADPH:quinone reductase); Similar to arginate lyase [hydrothermal vent metagenome]|uniref:Bifunctional protein: zinc-containing alcohol dehydrogenase quinone oxidoreductase ( NADPH:quinone reductase) Similar to arginate lyase n=1 Tax=hydrothermal vent metagenome TaxID=652676 RepID=A0A3B0S1F2_9ZZZZ
MRAIYYEKFGSADVLKIGNVPKPDIKPGQVLVHIAAAAVNPIDRRLRAGELQEFFQREWPIIPGFDFSGRIVETGDGVTGWQVGQDVVGLAFSWFLHGGTYAEYIAVDASAIAKKPDNISFIEGAALPLVSLTAWQALVEFSDLKPGQRVLIQAGAGGLGSVAISIAKYKGAYVYTTAREHNFDYVKSCGADFVIDYTASSYVELIRAREPDGLDVVLESLTSEAAITSAIHLVKPGGAVPYMNNPPPDMDEIHRKNIKTDFLHNRPDGQMLQDIMALYGAGKVRIPYIETMEMQDAAEAHRRSESGQTRGKMVLHIQDM